jgi:hypothetical protein
LKYESGTPLYQSQGGAGEWVVGAIPLSADVLSQGPDAIFAKFRDGVSGSKKGAISNSSSLQVKGYPASDMSFEAGAGLFGNEKGRMRLIIADDRLVMLAYGSHSAGDLNKPAVNGFFDSVTIDKHQAPVAVSSPGGSGPGLAPQSHISIAPVHIPEPPQVSIPEHHYEPPTMPGPSIPSGPSFPPGPSGPSGPSFGPGGPGGMSGPGGMGPGGMSPGGPGMGGGPYPGGGRF